MKLTKNFYENQAWENKKYVCGIDEVGRGCLAGPVVTAACILPLSSSYELLKDSKILTQQERETAFSWIEKNCFYSVAISDHKKIDSLNIYQTTKITMEKALMQLFYTMPLNIKNLEFVLTDAMPIDISFLKKDWIPDQVGDDTERNNLIENPKLFYFPKGESISQSIAAASIVAKVFRDNLMNKIDKIFPAYKFNSHKGYGTQDHVSAIQNSGVTIIHRKTFLNNIVNKNGEKQNSIF
ncbi:ribonuclease HII [Candidatus Dependentiae bacterium]|nr:ribonuclease HII [Candidatus Dependentiae bacterium]MBU4387351.1 ribonuclease HII [Candidatus Dependentiae bacterium]MCG2756184.1 ribonuclease HII [Candidatus Dependentiae bacterium]